jgi:hypothetical protein
MNREDSTPGKNYTGNCDSRTVPNGKGDPKNYENICTFDNECEKKPESKLGPDAKLIEEKYLFGQSL